VNVANVHYQGSLDVQWQYDSAFVETRHNGPPKNTVNSYLLLTQVHFFIYLTYVLHLKNLIMQSSVLFKAQHCNKILKNCS